MRIAAAQGLIKMGCRVLGDVDSPVIPTMLYLASNINGFSEACLRRNLAVVVVGYPATGIYAARARCCVAAAHTDEQLAHGLKEWEAAAQEVGVLFDRKLVSGSKGSVKRLEPTPPCVVASLRGDDRCTPRRRRWSLADQAAR